MDWKDLGLKHIMFSIELIADRINLQRLQRGIYMAGNTIILEYLPI